MVNTKTQPIKDRELVLLACMANLRGAQIPQNSRNAIYDAIRREQGKTPFVNESELKMAIIEREQSSWMARLTYTAFIGLLWIAAWHFAQFLTWKSLVQSGAGQFLR